MRPIFERTSDSKPRQIFERTSDETDDEPSVGGDISHILSNLPEYAQNFAKAIPSELEGAYHMPLGRSLKNIAAGPLQIANFPHQAAEYYASRHIPYLEKLIEHYPWKADLDPNKYLGLGERQPGDLALQSIIPTSILKNFAKEIASSAFNAAKKVPGNISKTAEKIADTAPLLNGIAAKPYIKQMQVLESKDLLGGYKPNPSDILEASRILKSPGMEIPHEAVNEAVAQTLEGNFKPWFQLQSSVRSEGRRLSKRGGVHTTLGTKLHNLAEKMHVEMGEAQAARGAPEAAKYMNQGKARYARYHKISPYAKVAGALASSAAVPHWVTQLLKIHK